MAKTKVVNQNSLVTEIMNVGGVNKENATKIFNIFTNAWNTDRIGTLKAVDSGIVVKRKKAVPTIKTTKAPKAVQLAPVVKKKTSKSKKAVQTVATVKTKGKKKLKTKSQKTVVPAKAASSQTATA
jgi:hypothetical protein